MTSRNAFNAAEYHRRVHDDAAAHFGQSLESVSDDDLYPWLEQHSDAEMQRLGIK